jgi:hypothetical protein
VLTTTMGERYRIRMRDDEIRLKRR